MQKKVLSAVILATAVVCGARAQETTVATPSSPAPAVQAPSANVQQAAPAATPQVAPTPNQVIYSPRLPSATELTSVAAAQGLTVEQINQTATQVTVIYRHASGTTNTVAYQLLPTASAPATTTTVVAPSPAPTVIYQSAPQVIYYDTYDYYRPRYYYNPPVSLHFGFGYSNFRHHHRRHW